MELLSLYNNYSPAWKNFPENPRLKVKLGTWVRSSFCVSSRAFVIRKEFSNLIKGSKTATHKAHSVDDTQLYKRHTRTHTSAAVKHRRRDSVSMSPLFASLPLPDLAPHLPLIWFVYSTCFWLPVSPVWLYQKTDSYLTAQRSADGHGGFDYVCFYSVPRLNICIRPLGRREIRKDDAKKCIWNIHACGKTLDALWTASLIKILA